MKRSSDKPFDREMFTPMSRAMGALLGALCLVSATIEMRAQDAPEEPRGGEVMRPGDSVMVSVFGEPSLEGTFTILPSGTITYPLLGTLVATGKDPNAFALEVEKLLETNYIKDAHVSAAVVDRPLQSISVIGEVQSPGVIEFPPEIRVSLFAAVAAAGGTTDKADSARIQVKRRQGENVKTLNVPLDSSGAYHLEGGDTVIVPTLSEVPAITVLGQVKKPGALPMTRGSEVDLLEAIAISGGFTEFARPSRVKVRREDGSKVKTFTVDVSKMQEEGAESFILSPGDTIIIPNRLF